MDLKLGKSKRLEIHILIYDFLKCNLDTVGCKIIRTISDVIQMTVNSARNVWKVQFIPKILYFH